MRQWLSEVFKSQGSLSEEAKGYLLGRGMRTETISDLHVFEWSNMAGCKPAPDVDFRDRYGSCGERLEGALIFPVWSTRGRLIGFEGRSRFEKRITDYRLPEAHWIPFFIGLTPAAMQSIWAGANVRIVEGVFDKAPLEWIFPQEVILATVRAHLSPWHISFLKRFVSGQVILCYDNDETGRKATREGVETLNRVGVKVVPTTYVGGKDPGEVWDRGGIPALKRAFLLED